MQGMSVLFVLQTRAVEGAGGQVKQTCDCHRVSNFATWNNITACKNTWIASIKPIDPGFLTHQESVEECQTWGGAVEMLRGEMQSQVAPGPAHKHRVCVNITRPCRHMEAEPGSVWYPVFSTLASGPSSERRGKAWKRSGRE